MAKTPSSPLTALGITNAIQPTNANFWNYERLSESTSDQIVAALEMVIKQVFLQRNFSLQKVLIFRLQQC